jgi:hypothetical protein
MKELCIDAQKVLYLGHEGILKTYSPPNMGQKNYQLYMNSSSPEDYLFKLVYRKSDVENFKLNYNELWEALQKQKRDATASSVNDYIGQQRLAGVFNEIIAFELHNPKGSFRLTYKEVAIALGLDKGLNADQHDAIKKQGQRACDKGKALLHKK